MTTQNSYRQEKDRFLFAYACIADRTHWFPLSTFASPQELLEKRAQLEQDNFTICVVGQMKAGKSTLLNALLFKADVLPDFPTPMTAAITRIEHASRSPTGQAGFQVAFYTEVEWSGLKEKCRTNSATDDFEADVKKARLAGVNEWELFGRAPQFHAGFDHLNEYVASMDNSGRYTPYVREATLYYDHPSLRDLTIVDTPGTNDSNVVRETITINYLRHADAVLFALSALRLFDASDLGFLRQQLGHIDRKKVVFVVTRMDQLLYQCRPEESYKRIWNIIRQHDHLKFYSELDQVVPVSAHAALCIELETRGGAKREGENPELDKLRRLGWLTSEATGIGKLNQVLETVLVQRKEETVLGSHRKTLGTLINGRYSDLGAKLAEKLRTLKDTESSSANLEHERKGIATLAQQYQAQCNALSKQVAPRFVHLLNEFERYCQERAARLPLKVVGVMDFNRPNQIKERLAIVFKGQLDDLLYDFHKELGKRLEKESREIRGLLRQELSSLDASFPIPEASLNAIIAQALDALPRPEMDGLMDEVSDTANGVYEDVYWFFERWFNTDLFSAKDARHKIEQELREVLEAPGKSPVERFIASVSAHMDQGVSSKIDSLLGNQIKDYLSRRQKDLERITNAGADLERLKRELEAECAALEAGQAEITGDAILQPFLKENDHV